MFPASSGRRLLMLAMILLAAFSFSLPALAQTTGILKGKVVDEKNQPVRDAKVTIEYKEGINRTTNTKTDKKGEFVQIGLQPGQYKVTVEKEQLGAQSQDVRVRLGDPTEVKFALTPGSTTATKEEVAKMEAVQATFTAGVEASKAGDFDTAIAKFNETLVALPQCPECYYNLGQAQAGKKDYTEAEAAFNKALEQKPDYADVYNGLATIYNAQKRFDEAGKASQKAAELAVAGGTAGGTGGGSVNTLYNQGVIAWNAGKADEARAKFEEALKLDPNHAESHFQLGMCLVNMAKYADAVKEFETYTTLAPSGPNVAQAQAMIQACKAQIK